MRGNHDDAGNAGVDFRSIPAWAESQCMESCPVRVLLVDDHSVMRDGLRLMLAGSGEFEVVGQTRDG